MTKADYTHITMILDRSGSMMNKREDVVGGVNQFFETQRQAPGQCTVTLVQFDDQDPYEILRDMAGVSDVKPLGKDYAPRGYTPLYDAVGRGIVNTGVALAALPEDQRPGKVVFVIVTDGLENASREYDRVRVAEMTREQTEKYGWDFVYLGANQDAMAEGEKFGVLRGRSASYKAEKTSGGIVLAAAKVAEYRTSGSKEALNFTEEDRKALS
jgi:hypothetical protein